jgi:hypothetical protein
LIDDFWNDAEKWRFWYANRNIGPIFPQENEQAVSWSF